MSTLQPWGIAREMRIFTDLAIERADINIADYAQRCAAVLGKDRIQQYPTRANSGADIFAFSSTACPMIRGAQILVALGERSGVPENPDNAAATDRPTRPYSAMLPGRLVGSWVSSIASVIASPDEMSSVEFGGRMCSAYLYNSTPLSNQSEHIEGMFTQHLYILLPTLSLHLKPQENKISGRLQYPL